MLKETKYLIKSLNYNKDTIPEDDEKNILSNAQHQNKNISLNNENNFINPSIDAKKYVSSAQKRYNGLKSLEAKKDMFNSFSDEVELSFEKNNTLLDDANFFVNNDKIYKKILENNKKSKENVRQVKIIKCEKININNRKERIFKMNLNSNHTFYETKIKDLNKKKLILKTDLINYDLNNINAKQNKVNKYKDNKNDNYSFEIDNKYTPLLSNKKEENQIILNHSIVFINQNRKEPPEKNKNKLNEQRKIIRKKIIKNENNKFTKEIKKKGYIDANDFMNAINEENSKNEKNENVMMKNKLNTQRINKGIKNKKIMDKKVIRLLKKINSEKNKIKIKEKGNFEHFYKNLQESERIKINLNNNPEKDKIDINNENSKINNDSENLNKEVEELKNNFHIKNFNDIRKNLNNFKLDKKKITKSLKVLQIERDNYKILKNKIMLAQQGNEIVKILENKQNKDEEINNQNNKLFKNNINETQKEKRNIISKKRTNTIININNLVKENKALKQNINVSKSYCSNINDINLNTERKKRSKNLILKTKNLGINLTRKIKKYYSQRNKTLEEINNSYKNINKIITNKENTNINHEIKNINNNNKENSDIINISNKTAEFNNNYRAKILSNNISDHISLTENEKSKDIKQNMNITTRDETGRIYNNSKDTENNELINLTKELVNENNQVKSSESQVISGINGPNTTYFSGFNKSDLKILNKINLDMPVNIDLDKEDNENNNEEKIDKNNKENKDIIKIEENENKNILNDSKDKDKKIEKLDNFINKFNDEQNKDKEIKIINFNNGIPTYGKSVAEINLSSNEKDFNYNKEDKKEKKLNDELLNINDIQSNIKSNFYDDININNDNLEEENINIKDIQNYSNKNLDFKDINFDLPKDDQDFLDNIELIQKNNLRLLSPKEMENKKENKTENETIKELETEYEFNLDEEKFCEPLQKYESKLNFDKINPF